MPLTNLIKNRTRGNRTEHWVKVKDVKPVKHPQSFGQLIGNLTPGTVVPWQQHQQMVSPMAYYSNGTYGTLSYETTMVQAAQQQQRSFLGQAFGQF